MPYDPSRHHRRSIRLPGYDYATPGAYFVTICTHRRRPVFADPDAAQIAAEQWEAVQGAGMRGALGPRAAVDAWVVMPDHVHAVIIIGEAPSRDVSSAAGSTRGGVRPDAGVGDGHEGAAAVRQGRGAPRSGAPGGAGQGASAGLGIGVAPGSLGAIVRSYKAAVARRINRRRRATHPPVWQRGYWESIVRDGAHLAAVQRYVERHEGQRAAPGDLDRLLARMQLRD